MAISPRSQSKVFLVAVYVLLRVTQVSVISCMVFVIIDGANKYIDWLVDLFIYLFIYGAW